MVKLFTKAVFLTLAWSPMGCDSGDESSHEIAALEESVTQSRPWLKRPKHPDRVYLALDRQLVQVGDGSPAFAELPIIKVVACYGENDNPRALNDKGTPLNERVELAEFDIKPGNRWVYAKRPYRGCEVILGNNVPIGLRPRPLTDTGTLDPWTQQASENYLVSSCTSALGGAAIGLAGFALAPPTIIASLGLAISSGTAAGHCATNAVNYNKYLDKRAVEMSRLFFSVAFTRSLQTVKNQLIKDENAIVDSWRKIEFGSGGIATREEYLKTQQVVSPLVVKAFNQAVEMEFTELDLDTYPELQEIIDRDGKFYQGGGWLSVFTESIRSLETDYLRTLVEQAQRASEPDMILSKEYRDWFFGNFPYDEPPKRESEEQKKRRNLLKLAADNKNPMVQAQEEHKEKNLEEQMRNTRVTCDASQMRMCLADRHQRAKKLLGRYPAQLAELNGQYFLGCEQSFCQSSPRAGTQTCNRGDLFSCVRGGGGGHCMKEPLICEEEVQSDDDARALQGSGT